MTDKENRICPVMTGLVPSQNGMGHDLRIVNCQKVRCMWWNQERCTVGIDRAVS